MTSPNYLRAYITSPETTWFTGSMAQESQHLSSQIPSLLTHSTSFTRKRIPNSVRKMSSVQITRRRSSRTPAGPTFINCTESQEQDLISAAQFAQDYASNAFLYANSISSKTSRYSTWFGLYSKKRHDLVVSQFSAISAANFSTFTYDCSCTTSNVYAYVYPDE